MVRRIGGFAQPHQHVRRLDQLLGPGDADRLNCIVTVAQPSRVGQHDWHSSKREGYLDIVARRPRKMGNDRPLLPSYHVDKAGLPGIRWTRDDDSYAILQAFDPRPLE